MIAQIGRFNMIAAALALVCFVFWTLQVRPQPVNAPQYNFSLSLRPPLPPDARAGARKSGHSQAGSNTEDQFQGEVVSPDGDDDDQTKSGKGDDDSDDQMNPEDQVYPI
jgi:hypothetical protein